MTRLVSALLAVLSASLAVGQLEALPASQPVIAAPNDAADFLARGLAELKAGHPRQAQGLFIEGLALFGPAVPAKLEDDTQINLNHGLAVAQIRVDESTQARQIMDRLRNASKTNSSIQFNDAVLDVQTRNNLQRGISTMEKLLASAVDEPSLNLYGFAISRLESDSSTRPRAAALWQNYQNYEQRLNPPSPALRHWGSSWISETQMKAIQAEKTRIAKRRDDLSRRLATLESQLPAARQTAASRQTDLEQARQRNARPAVVAQLSRLADQASVKANNLETEYRQKSSELANLDDGPKPTFAVPQAVDPDPQLRTR